MSLTKDDIVEAVAKQVGFPKKQSVESVEVLLELIKKTLVSGDDVLVSGFGKFYEAGFPSKSILRTDSKCSGLMFNRHIEHCDSIAIIPHHQVNLALKF